MLEAMSTSSLPDPHQDNDDLEEETALVHGLRFAQGTATLHTDLVAREEPLEIQLGATPLAVMMRTPGYDEELTLGLLQSEGVISGISDVLAVRHCSITPYPQADGNVIRVTLAPHVRVDHEALRRNLYASASCGVCGKATLENVLRAVPPLDDPARFEADFFSDLPERLRAAQVVFAQTGGLHAAGLCAPDGTLLVVREDVGRHNAVDKVIGWALREGKAPLTGHVLVVSGRISFEIAQKALMARIPVIAAVSAPSSLAISLASTAHLTLVTFLRNNSFNLFGETQRVFERITHSTDRASVAP